MLFRNSQSLSVAILPLSVIPTKFLFGQLDLSILEETSFEFLTISILTYSEWIGTRELIFWICQWHTLIRLTYLESRTWLQNITGLRWLMIRRRRINGIGGIGGNSVYIDFNEFLPLIGPKGYIVFTWIPSGEHVRYASAVRPIKQRVSNIRSHKDKHCRYQ